ncbi:MAG TPA: lipid II flippase MurJ, partial [Thermoanaerobaculia bacterium]|nr:lipid II flippase MurJ [Thermoanaerobaculia bacterium]
MKLNVSLGVLAAANLFAALAIQWYVVTRLGVGTATDALFAGMAIPQLVLEVVSGSLMHVLVPLLATEDREAFAKTAWGLFLAIGAIFSALAVALSVSAPLWLRWLLPGFKAEALRLTISLTRIQLIGMVFTALLSVLWSTYHARSRFLWAELTPVLGSAAG